MRSLFVQTFMERRVPLAVTSAGLLMVSLLVIGLFPVLSQLQPWNPVIENMPKLFEAFLGELSYLRKFETFVASQLFAIHLPLVLGGVAVWYGWHLSVRPERLGEFGRILAGSVSRTRLVIVNWLVLVSLLGVNLVVVGAGIYALAPFVEGETVIRIATLAKLLLVIWLYACAVASVVYAIGIATSRGGIAIALGIVLVLISYYISLFSEALPALASYQALSLMTYVAATNVVLYGIAWSHIGLLLAVNLVMLTLALGVFNMRDVAR